MGALVASAVGISAMVAIATASVPLRMAGAGRVDGAAPAITTAMPGRLLVHAAAIADVSLLPLPAMRTTRSAIAVHGAGVAAMRKACCGAGTAGRPMKTA
jgi:hypothetical protein